jgi:SAM domain (Sterile alpha motif)
MMDARVSTWLEDLDLGTYREAFQQNAITWDVLPELNQHDLEALGVLLGHRKHSPAPARMRRPTGLENDDV